MSWIETSLMAHVAMVKRAVICPMASPEVTCAPSSAGAAMVPTRHERSSPPKARK